MRQPKPGCGSGRFGSVKDKPAADVGVKFVYGAGNKAKLARSSLLVAAQKKRNLE
jgi:hypothetical protein